MHYADPGSGALEQRGIYYPPYGRDSDWSATSPNHGQCVDTCGSEDEQAVTGYSTNDIYHTEWANGVGKAQLWRQSWNQFSYAGSDGLTPTILYDSPWAGDGGVSPLVAASTVSATFGDGAEINSTQSHSILSLVSGGISPYRGVSVTSTNNCTVTLNTDDTVSFTAGGTAGAFAYSFTVIDSELSSASGSVSGTLVDSSAATALHFDQDGEVYISIDPTNSHEYFARGGNTWTAVGGAGSPDNTYMQNDPYNGTVASGDVETDSAELVYRVHFDAAGTYTAYIKGMALASTNYDSVWVGFDNVVDTNRIQVTVGTIPIDSSDWYWDDGTGAGGSAVQITTSGAEDHTFHVWKREGGFALGKIVITSGSAPTGAGPAESPENLY